LNCIVTDFEIVEFEAGSTTCIGPINEMGTRRTTALAAVELTKHDNEFGGVGIDEITPSTPVPISTCHPADIVPVIEQIVDPPMLIETPDEVPATTSASAVPAFGMETDILVSLGFDCRPK
jgi:hypothetical protein